MPMNGNQLGSEIAAAITDAEASSEAQAQVLELWKKIGSAIVKHITTNAQVPSGIAVSTTGSAAAQTGATTGTGVVM